MRTIEEHKVNPANDTLILQTLDEPGHGDDAAARQALRLDKREG